MMIKLLLFKDNTSTEVPAQTVTPGIIVPVRRWVVYSWIACLLVFAYVRWNCWADRLPRWDLQQPYVFDSLFQVYFVSFADTTSRAIQQQLGRMPDSPVRVLPNWWK